MSVKTKTPRHQSFLKLYLPLRGIPAGHCAQSSDKVSLVGVRGGRPWRRRILQSLSYEYFFSLSPRRKNDPAFKRHSRRSRNGLWYSEYPWLKRCERWRAVTKCPVVKCSPKNNYYHTQTLPTYQNNDCPHTSAPTWLSGAPFQGWSLKRGAEG